MACRTSSSVKRFIRSDTGLLCCRKQASRRAIRSGGMSIAPFDAQMIVREHCLRPLPDTVHLIGRQTVLLTEAEAVSLLRAHGLTPAPRAVALDQDTFGAKVAGGRGYISDTSFFGLLGVSAVHAIDHSDYEGADIIIDLNEPLPEAYGASADFIYGGSVLDNIFDPATYMKNIACLLRPDGRLIDGNVCSFHHHPYVLVPPAWYFDYYAINHFTDCKVYVVETGDPLYVYGLTVKPGDPLIQDFGNGSQGAAVGVVVIAEKGRDSTWNHVPSQDQYRSDGEWQRWREGVEHIQRSLRVYHNYGSLTEREFECRPPRRLKSFQFLGKFRPDEQWDFNPAQYAALELEGKPSIAGIRIVKATYGWNNATDRK